MTRLAGIFGFAAALALALPALAVPAPASAGPPASSTATSTRHTVRHRYYRHTAAHRVYRRSAHRAAVRRTTLRRISPRKIAARRTQSPGIASRRAVYRHAAWRQASYRRYRESARYRRRRYIHRDPAVADAAPEAAAAVAADTVADTVPDVAAGISYAPIHFVPPLRGSRASLLRQNQRDAAEGLTRIQDEAQLLDLEASRELVPIPVSVALIVNPRLPRDRRYCRPWTAVFLAALARSHYQRFHAPLEVTSAVRTVSFQRHLERINGNAAPWRGELASPHLSGAAIDIAKKGMSFSELSWMRGWLLPLQAAGKLDVEEEFEQACFHIDVYSAWNRAPRAPHRSTIDLVAAGVR